MARRARSAHAGRRGPASRGGSRQRIRHVRDRSGFEGLELVPQVAMLFGLDPETAGRSFSSWESVIFVDDVPKIHEAFRAARRTGTFYVEFRVKHSDGRLHWIAGKGQMAVGEPSSMLRGALFEITERKALEARLLAVNETLEARVVQVREEARTLELLNRTGVAVAAELDLEKLVQMVTDAGVELSHAEFGAFFYNVIKRYRRSRTRSTRSRARRAKRSKSFRCRATRRSSNRPSAAAGRCAPTTFSPTPGMAKARPTTACRKATCRCEAIWPCRSLALGRSAGRALLRACPHRRFHRARRTNRDRLGGAGRRRDRQRAPLPDEPARNGRADASGTGTAAVERNA